MRLARILNIDKPIFVEKQGFQIRADNDWRQAKTLKLEADFAQKTQEQKNNNFTYHQHQKTTTKHAKNKVKINQEKDNQKFNKNQENNQKKNQQQSP